MMDSEPLKNLPKKGVYTLIFYLSKPIRIRVGKLGLCPFRKGYYAYTGSALGETATSLPKRVARHLKRLKRKKRWHIDFLLANKNITILSVIATQTTEKQECLANQSLKQITDARVPVKNFGASDCQKLCKAHLLYFGEKNVFPTILAIYKRKFNSNPFVLNLKTMTTQMQQQGWDNASQH